MTTTARATPLLAEHVDDGDAGGGSEQRAHDGNLREVRDAAHPLKQRTLPVRDQAEEHGKSQDRYCRCSLFRAEGES